jgi:hypothetical protein
MAETAAPQEFYDAVAAAVNAHDLDFICGLARAAGLTQEQFQQMMEIIWTETQDTPHQVVTTG